MKTCVGKDFAHFHGETLTLFSSSNLKISKKKTNTEEFSLGDTGTDLFLHLQFASWLRIHLEGLSLAGCSGSCEWMWGHCWWGLCGLGGALGPSVCGSVYGVSVGLWEVPVWGQCGSLCGDTKWVAFDSCLFCTLGQEKGSGTCSFLALAVLSVFLCVTSPHRGWVSTPLTPGTHLSASLRGPSGSQAQGPCSVSSPPSSGGHSVAWVPALPSDPG